VGEAQAREVGEEILTVLSFNLDSASGRDGAASQGMHEGRQVRFLGPVAAGGPGIESREVSPVLGGSLGQYGHVAGREDGAE
jgi:hypothetical protein